MKKEDYKDISLDEGVNIHDTSAPAETKSKKESTPTSTESSPIATYTDNKKRIFMWAGILILVVLGLSVWGVNNTHNNNTAQVTQSQTKSKAVFKQALSVIVKAQDTKQDLNAKWRAATQDYGNDNNRDKYRSAITDLNKERIDAYDSIKDNNSPLAKDVLKALEDMHTAMQGAFSAEGAKDAIDIYNNWNESDKGANKTYMDELISQLKKNDIKYTVKDNNGAGAQISY